MNCLACRALGQTVTLLLMGGPVHQVMCRRCQRWFSQRGITVVTEGVDRFGGSSERHPSTSSLTAAASMSRARPRVSAG